MLFFSVDDIVIHLRFKFYFWLNSKLIMSHINKIREHIGSQVENELKLKGK